MAYLEVVVFGGGGGGGGGDDDDILSCKSSVLKYLSIWFLNNFQWLLF